MATPSASLRRHAELHDTLCAQIKRLEADRDELRRLILEEATAEGLTGGETVVLGLTRIVSPKTVAYDKRFANWLRQKGLWQCVTLSVKAPEVARAIKEGKIPADIAAQFEKSRKPYVSFNPPREKGEDA